MSSVYWLLSDDALQRRLVREIREARTPLNAWAPPKVEARAGAELPAPLSISNGVATIRVEGVLTPVPDLMAELYGEANTTYPDLQAALSAALADSAVREIVWSIDSPGGSVDGYHDLVADIADARALKPMRVMADNAQSAAYGIAAAAGPITATSRTASFGSVGVATSGFIQGGLCGKVVDITNSDSPDKRPNLETEEGRAVVIKYLDQIAAEFMGGIAQGRGVKVSDVAEGYGRGASMLAPAALESGLIDGIAARKRKGPPGVYGLDHTRTVGYGPASMAESAPAEPTQAEPAPAPAGDPPAGDPPAETEAEPEAPVPAEPPAGDPPAQAAATVTISAAEHAELQALRAERDARATAERAGLVGELVALGAERPATAYADGKLVARLASEPLAELRERVNVLKAHRAPTAATPLAPPPVGPEASDLTPSQAKEAERLRKINAAQADRFVALCRDQNRAKGKA